MTKPTQLVISEQAREAAEKISDVFGDVELMREPQAKHKLEQEIQLLLNSQRETIIRELKPFTYHIDHCRKVAEMSDGHFACSCGLDAILAKLQNK